LPTGHKYRLLVVEQVVSQLFGPATASFQQIDIILPILDSAKYQCLAVRRVAHVEYLLIGIEDGSGPADACRVAHPVHEAIAGRIVQAKGHLAPAEVGHGYLAVAAPGQRGQAALNLLVGSFVAAVQQRVAVRAIAVGHHHAVAALVIYGICWPLGLITGCENSSRPRRLRELWRASSASAARAAMAGCVFSSR
jgi:hypothetical protein